MTIHFWNFDLKRILCYMRAMYSFICCFIFVYLVAWFGWIHLIKFHIQGCIFWVSECVYIPVLKIMFSNGKLISRMTSNCQNYIQRMLFCTVWRYIDKVVIYPLVNLLTFKKPVFSQSRLRSVHNLVMADQKLGTESEWSPTANLIHGLHIW